MLKAELLQLWSEAVQLADARDWQGAVRNFQQITEPSSHILFNLASAYLALGQLQSALKVGAQWTMLEGVLCLFP